MKTRLITLLIVCLLSVSGSFAQKCTTPLSSIEFRQIFNQLTAIRSDQQRLTRAQSLFSGKCLLTYQVKEVADQFADDVLRLSFVKDIYPSIFDKENIYDVYDAFTYFSTVFMLYDFVSEQKAATVGSQGPGNDNKVSFPNYDYPDPYQYTGNKQCDMPLVENAFMPAVRNMRHRDENTRTRMATDMVDKYCISVAQVMKLASLLNTDDNKIQLLKHAYPKVYDVDNFNYCKQVFTNSKARIDFVNYMNSLQNTQHGHQESVQTVQTGKTQKAKCEVTDQELNEIITTIKQQSFASTKMAVGKQAIEAKKCFSTSQIKQVLMLFAHDSEKLDMAKYCYDFCTDKSNYFQLNSVFSFSSSVTQLTNYVRSKQ